MLTNSYDSKVRVVVTGIGILSAIGNGKRAFLEGLRSASCGIEEIRSLDAGPYPIKLGAEIKNFNLDGYGLKDGGRFDGVIQNAICAAKEALDESGILEHANSYKIGVSMATSLGSARSREQFYDTYLQTGELDYDLLLQVPPSCISGAIAQYFQISGPNSTLVTACAAGGNSLGISMDWIRSGRAVSMVAGGVDPFSAISLSGFTVLKSLSSGCTQPFDADREGLSLGEAAAVLVLEEYEHAAQRGAAIYAEILGYGISNDAYHITSPDPKGDGALRSMQIALADAGIKPEAVDYINAHGTGTPYNDKMELLAIERLFGERAKQIPISSSKSQLGHTLGTAGSIEAIVSIMGLKYGFVPATINMKTAMDARYNFVSNELQQKEYNITLSNSFAFAGNTASVVFKRFEEPEATEKGDVIGDLRISV
jgi:3-oxoacyl-[acyl-carrier-protein] synthase II